MFEPKLGLVEDGEVISVRWDALRECEGSKSRSIMSDTEHDGRSRCEGTQPRAMHAFAICVLHVVAR